MSRPGSSGSGADLHLALLGDAGYKGDAKARVLDMIRGRHNAAPFDMVIHLGDTCFGGSPREILESLLAPFQRSLSGRIATLCGNHDLYYGCSGYLSALRHAQPEGPLLRDREPVVADRLLDTTLAARGFRRNDGLLDDDQLEWLQRLAGASERKPLILLSHHYIRSHWHGPIE